MTGDATTPELPRGLLEDELAGMRVGLGELAGIADRLDADGGDLEALEQSSAGQDRHDRACGPDGEDYAVSICAVGIGTCLEQNLDRVRASPADGECEWRDPLRLLWVWAKAARAVGKRSGALHSVRRSSNASPTSTLRLVGPSVRAYPGCSPLGTRQRVA